MLARRLRRRPVTNGLGTYIYILVMYGNVYISIKTRNIGSM